MALSDCISCWNTPCDCGNDYKDWSDECKFIVAIISKKPEINRRHIVKLPSYSQCLLIVKERGFITLIKKEEGGFRL